MFVKIQEAVEALNYEYMQSFKVENESRIQDLKKICSYLEDICMKRGIQFVHGRGKRKSKTQNISKRENMTYNENDDNYTCHNRKRLSAVYIKNQKSKSGYKSEVTVYECEDCTGCPYKVSSGK